MPAGWNPTKPLQVGETVTLLTDWKLERAVASPDACFAALEGAARFAQLPDFETTPQCHIKGRLELNDVAGVSLAPIETRCAIALRMAMWAAHDLKPSARQLLGTELTTINQIGSYNCRQIRTVSGASDRWSTHATADAIDISGFGFADGSQARLTADWDDGGPRGAFLKEARDSACRWFRVTLSPDYNRLHADHFHLQSAGWGLCR